MDGSRTSGAFAGRRERTHGHDLLGGRGFSLGEWAFGHVIPLGLIAVCGGERNGMEQGRQVGLVAVRKRHLLARRWSGGCSGKR